MLPFLEAVVSRGGSDLHLRADAPAKVRIGGALVEVTSEPVPAAEVTEMIRASMTDDVLATYDACLEADYALAVPGLGRFRANAFRTRGTDGCVLRLIGDEPVPLEALGMPEAVRTLALRPRGLVLVTGPTGSGKTTTLAAMVDVVNRERAVHVLTLEDPIEVIHPSKRATVTQRELGSDSLAWSSALRAAMRQDPDVILIGEMRDADTVRAALSAAETGHMVLSTLHTTDALETIHRIVDFFPPHEQRRVRASLAASLEGIVCQRLVPRADGTGRVCVMEIAVRDVRLAEAVGDADKSESIPDIIADGTYSGMQTFDQDLLRLTVDGTVSPATAQLAASNPHDFRVMLKRAGWRPDEARLGGVG